MRFARGGVTSVPLLLTRVLLLLRVLQIFSERMRPGCMNHPSHANDYPQAADSFELYPQIGVADRIQGTFWDDEPVEPRFLTLADVAETLNISASQAYALVRSGDLPAIKVGGRGQWRVEAKVLEEYIQRMYEQTRSFIAAYPADDITEVP